MCILGILAQKFASNRPVRLSKRPKETSFLDDLAKMKHFVPFLPIYLIILGKINFFSICFGYA
jgi:hypothetical protein